MILQTCFEYITFRTLETTRKIPLGAAVIRNSTSILILLFKTRKKTSIKQIVSIFLLNCQSSLFRGQCNKTDRPLILTLELFSCKSPNKSQDQS